MSSIINVNCVSLMHIIIIIVVMFSLLLSLRLDKSGDIKVGDFGLTEDVYSTGYFRQQDRENVKLPFKWMAPESLNDGIFTEKTDVVSL